MVIDIPMVKSLVVSFWTIANLKPIIIKLTDELWNIGYGESILLPFPMTHFEYFETWLKTLEKYILPSILGKEIVFQENNFSQMIEDFIWSYSHIQNYQMTKVWVENAFIHILTQRLGKNIYEMFETKKEAIKTEICFWIPDNMDAYLSEINNAITHWYDTIKLKISQGRDVDIIKTVREHFPKISINLDANQSYTLDSFKEILPVIGSSNIEMIEQPFKYDDFLENIEIKKIMKTKLCLDESICRMDQLENMIKYNGIDILNIKIWRVGGIYSAYKINKYCEAKNIPTWVWWLLETSIWKGFNLAIAGMNNCTYANDFSTWNEFYSDYLTLDPDTIENWEIKIDLQAKWLGFEIDESKLENYCIQKITI